MTEDVRRDAGSGGAGGVPDGKAEAKRRLAAALRANLRRRKASRGPAEGTTGPDGTARVDGRDEPDGQHRPDGDGRATDRDRAISGGDRG